MKKSLPGESMAANLQPYFLTEIVFFVKLININR